jgi:hypothetical protein
MSKTPRFELPFILPGQAQKELFHNEALSRVDALLHPTVEGPPVADPPLAPVPGQSWIVGAAATGAWSGREGQLASWTDGGWRFLVPTQGMAAWQKAAEHWLVRTAAGWSMGEIRAAGLVIGGTQVVGERQPAIATPSGGTIIDEEARAALAAVIASLMSHGLID